MSEERSEPKESVTAFQILCGSLGAQVHMALGLLPDPVSKEATVELDVARQGIGLIEMLEEKTKGNLTPEETRTLGGLLAQLRMLYVQRLRQAREEGAEKPGAEGREEPGAEGREEPGAEGREEPGAEGEPTP